MAPPLGALVGIATMGLWERRERWTARLGLAGALAATVWWSVELLGRTSDWFPALRPFVAVVGALGVVAILALPLLRSVPKLAVALVSVLGLGAALAAPLFSTVATAATPHQGAIPSVTPTAAGGLGGPGRGGFPAASRRRSPGLRRGRLPRRWLPGHRRWRRRRRLPRRSAFPAVASPAVRATAPARTAPRAVPAAPSVVPAAERAGS